MYCLHKHWVKDLKIYLLLPTYFENLCLAKHLSNHLMSKKPTFWTLLGIEFELLTGSSLAAFEAALAKESLLSGLRSLWASYSLCSVIGSVNLKNVNRLISHFNILFPCVLLEKSEHTQEGQWYTVNWFTSIKCIFSCHTAETNYATCFFQKNRFLAFRSFLKFVK